MIVFLFRLFFFELNVTKSSKMDLPQNDETDSTTETNWNRNNVNEPLMRFEDDDDMPAINAANPNFHPVTPPRTTTTITHNPVVDSLGEKAKSEIKKGQHQAEDIITRTKRICKEHCKFH